MVFSSSTFLFLFLPVTMIGYFLCKGKLRNYWLLALSLVFYGWGEPKYILLLLFSIAVNYFLGIAIDAHRSRAKFILIATVIYNIGMLGIFKYANFFFDNVNALFGSNIVIASIALPIGISFYTFQILSYVIDVYRRDVPTQKNILDLALYVALFPQLIAGPIVRYSDVITEISSRQTTADDFRIGTARFINGFIKKVVLADTIATVADTAFAGTVNSTLLAWIGAIAYSLQIYYDFSGYSDMAIGLGRIFGFHFLENFNYPYISQSIQEFWRRWHISLGSWFRDYVYFPLGGSRKGKIRTYLNLVIVFFLVGLWHGASWNFVVWGLFYVVFLIIERLGFAKVLKRLPRVLRHVYALLIIIVGRIFFRADTLSGAFSFIASMFHCGSGSINDVLSVISLEDIVLILCGIVFSAPVLPIREKVSVPRWILLFIGLLAAIACMTGKGYSPFLYFRF